MPISNISELPAATTYVLFIVCHRRKIFCITQDNRHGSTILRIESTYCLFAKHLQIIICFPDEFNIQKGWLIGCWLSKQQLSTLLRQPIDGMAGGGVDGRVNLKSLHETKCNRPEALKVLPYPKWIQFLWVKVHIGYRGGS